LAVTDVPDLVAARPAHVVREAVAVGLAGLAIAAFNLHIWHMRLSEPLTSGNDSNFYAMAVRGMMRNGGYFDNPDLGWPFAQQLHDLPQGADNFNYLLLRLFAAITRSPWGGINVFFLLTFATVGACAYVAFRFLGLRRGVAALLAIIYDIAPYHFIRGEQHLLLAAYEFVPLALVLVLSMFNAEPPLSRRRADGKVRPAIRKSWWVIALIAAIASSGSYYLVFTLLLVAVAAVMSAVRRPSWRPIMSAVVIGVIGVGVFAINVSPSLVFYARNGSNPAVAARSPVETELYGLKISQMFVPRQAHRVPALSKLSERSQGNVVISEGGQQLGVIGAAGLLVVVGAVVASALGRTKSRLGHRLVPLGLLTLTCIAVATVSGFSLFISSAGLSYIRSWNRVTILIAFFALLGLGHVIEWWLDHRRPGRGRVLGLAAGLFLIAGFDQMSPRDVPAYRALHATAKSNKALFGRVFADQGAGAGVLTWPHLPFPEHERRGGTGPYDQAIGYIVEPRLHYSYGFVSGRYPDFPMTFEKKPAPEWLTDTVAVGYRALVVDREAVDGPFKVPDVEPSLTPVLGEPTMVSADGRYAYYDLRAFAADATTRIGAEALAARGKAVLAG
jgi:hypothetical protein